MQRFITKSLALVALVGAFTFAATSQAEAAFVAYICDDVACLGANDAIVTDNGAGDLGLSGTTAGRINMEAAIGGLTIVTNIAKSKPLVGSASNPIMDITFSAEGIGTAFIWAVDTDFTGLTPLNGALDGNFSGASCVQAGLGTSAANDGALAYQAVSAQSCASPFSLQVSHPGSGSSPYSMALVVAVQRDNAGTTTGDYLVVPEPASMALLGLGLAALAARRRRQTV